MEDILKPYKEKIAELKTRISQLESQVMTLSKKPIKTMISYWQNNSVENISELIDGVLYVEEWKDIKGFEGLYQISSYGRIKSFSLWGKDVVRIMKQGIKNTGYIRVSICTNGKSYCPSVHFLVAEHFLEKIPGKIIINHLNGCKHDNRSINLQYCTASENIRHAYDTGLNKIKMGEESSTSKLKNVHVLEIVNSNLSTKILAQKYGVSHTTITNIRSGREWSHLTNKVYDKPPRLTEEQVMSIFSCTLSFEETAFKYNVTKKKVILIKAGWLHKKITGIKEIIPIRKRMTPELIKEIKESTESNVFLSEKYNYCKGTISLIKSDRYYIENGRARINRY